MSTAAARLNLVLAALPAGAAVILTEEMVTALQQEFPGWIPARDPDGVVRVSNCVMKPYQEAA